MNAHFFCHRVHRHVLAYVKLEGPVTLVVKLVRHPRNLARLENYFGLSNQCLVDPGPAQ